MLQKTTKQIPVVSRVRVGTILLTGIFAAWLCPAGEVTYLETFETNIVSKMLFTAVSNGVLRAWVTLPPHNPTNASLSLRSINLPGSRLGAIKQGRNLELRADILRVAGEGAYAALGWSEEGIPAIGYRLLLNTREVALVKHRFDQQVLAPFFWEALSVTNRPMRVFLRFSLTESNLLIQTQVLDQENPNQVIFERAINDSLESQLVVATPPPLQAATPDPGPAWRGAGPLQLSLFGANTNMARLEMEVDNFGARATQEVTVEDCVGLVYTNGPGETLPYRLFIPTNQQSGILYPLVLGLHGGDVPGDDNVSQFYPEYLVFLSAESQARHPCFLVLPQMPAAVYQADDVMAWWEIRQSVVALVELLQAQYPIDRDRVYIVGGSLGGTGTWSLADNYPNLFAAAVPMAGLDISENMRTVTDLPIWAFHGGRDSLVPPGAIWTGEGWTAKASRGLIADLRSYGACPIYTEYAWPGHGIFGVAYDTPGLVDWLMAQHRGKPAQQSPWVAVTTPALNGILITSYTNLNLAGTACADAGITNVVWRNETMRRTGPAGGTTNWVATGIPLRLGRTTATGIIASTNVITVTATGTSGSELYGGTTTFNAALQVLHVPVRLQARIEGGQTLLEWTGAAQSFVVQRCVDLISANWLDVVTTGETNLVLPHASSPEFYRIKLP